MGENHVLVEHESPIKQVLAQTFQSMQRIKLTCFDISSKYIVFGASSGGIYIFSREPCQFIKLIPSKEGSATKVLISPDEKKIAISSSKGLILILDNILDLNYEVYSEHEGQMVTALKWHNTDLFCGDHTGKISVITVTNILAKAIFQSSAASLMHLDSEIVQIDCYSKYLLITTQTRAYFCDTERQQYRQIGKKLRDGPFGACFFNVPSVDDLVIPTPNGYLFQSIRDDELFITTSTDVKIYCARPGARLWEVNFQAVVHQTHQFRASLTKPPSDIIHIGNQEDARLRISKFQEPKSVPDDFSFGKLLNLLNKFILTFDNKGVYIFDPQISELVCWTNSMKAIKDVKVVNSWLYIWRDNMQIDVLSLLDLEKLVLRTLVNKQYYLCAELCATFSPKILELLDSSSKLYLLTSLESKLDNNDLLEGIGPILERLKEVNRQSIRTKKLTNGIVLIENSFSNIPESVQSFQYSEEKTTKPVIITTTTTTTTDENIQVYTMFKQYKLHRTHNNIDIPDFCKLFESDAIFSCIQKFIEFANVEHQLDVTGWCQEQALKQLSKNELNPISEDFILYLKKAFTDVNGQDPAICKCQYPLPKAHVKRPKYYKLGSKLLNWATDDLRAVPYMYKKRLENLQNQEEICKNLPLLVQYCDDEIFKRYLNKFTYDTWDETVKFLLKLKKGICLNCDDKIDISHALSWTNLGVLMVQSIGGQNATKLLKRYAQFIPNGDLDAKFYQACIFSTVTSENQFKKKGVNFLDEILNSNSSCEFEKQMMGYLRNKHLGKFAGTSSSASLPNCCYCSLPMNTPMINDPSRLPCGHVFHTLCLKHNNNICHVCDSNLV